MRLIKGQGDESRGRRRAALILALAGLLVIAGSASSVQAKKKKAKSPAVTTTAATSLLPGTQAATTANCPAKTHVSGGGFSVTPAFNPAGTESFADDSGNRITHLQSQPAGNGWAAGAGAFASPATAGTFNAIARCESSSLGKVVGGPSGSTTVPVSQGTTVALHCPAGTHVLTAGFSASPAGDLANPVAFRLVVSESRRLDPTTWEIHVVNPSGAASDATLAANAVCERNAKGLSVTEVPSVAPIADNSRASATATCTGKKHVVGGGFLVSPTTGPAVGIDQSQPVGNKSWQVGLYEYPGYVLPAGSTLNSYAYCKNDSPPKAKKKS